MTSFLGEIDIRGHGGSDFFLRTHILAVEVKRKGRVAALGRDVGTQREGRGRRAQVGTDLDCALLEEVDHESAPLLRFLIDL